MKEEKDHIRDIAEIRAMMERSTKFLSLSGWAGIMAGFYALAGVYGAYSIFDFWPDRLFYRSSNLTEVIFLATCVLLFALGSAIFFSHNKAAKQGENLWNATSRRLLLSMCVPLFAGGIMIAFLILKGLTGLIAPLTLIFYGLALFNAGNYTIAEVRWMGVVQMLLGLLNIWYIEYGLWFWAAGFGGVHIVYGIYMHLRYER